MELIVGIIVGLLVLMILVVLHEFGHFIMARRNGVRVLEFGIGFPPRAVAWIKDPRTHKWRKLKKSEWDKAGLLKTVLAEQEKEKENPTTKPSAKAAKVTKEAEERQALTSGVTERLFADGMIFSINYLPIGGFCQMDGESAIDERPGTFGKASFWKKTKILFAGVAMNWLTAFVILTVLAWTGMPTFLENQFTIDSDTKVVVRPVRVTEVMEDSPAEKAKIQVGDEIVKIDDEIVGSGSEIIAYNSEHAGEEVVYTILRTETTQPVCIKAPCPEITAAVERDITVKLNPADSEYLIGIAMQSSQSLSYSTWSAPVVGAGVTLQITSETFKGLGDMIWNLVSGVGRLFSPDESTRESGQEAISAVGDSVSGPVGIIGVLFPSFTSAGPTNLAFLAALISISLACMNVLPIPALDGGRWLLLAIFKLRKKKLTPEIEQRIVARSMYVLLILMAIVTILDITRFF